MIIEIAPIDGEPRQFSIVEFQVPFTKNQESYCLLSCPILAQGNLLPSETANLNGLEIGSLQNVNDKPVIIIGPHILEGKIEKLSPPLLVLRREDGKLTSGELDGNFRGVMVVEGIAKQKILFKSRPKLGLKAQR